MNHIKVRRVDMIDFDTIMILDLTSIIIYSIYICGVIIAVFYLGYLFGKNYWREG